MTYCPKCGTPLVNGAAFCSACGAAAVQKDARREEVYEGVVRRCPNCGEILNAFSATCPSCGFELRGVEASGRVNNLAIKLESIDNAEEKNNLIRNFYIPNTKEDIYEFFILATSNIEAGGESTDAWYAKLDQAYKKASLVFGEGEEFERLKELYSKTDRARIIKKSFTSISRNRGVQGAVLFVVGTILTVIGQFAGSASGDPNSPFYMLGLLGLMPIMGAFCLFVMSISGEKG